MANQYYDVRVDVAKSDVFDSGLRFTQGDSKVIFLRIAVMNNGAKFDASNTTPSVNFVKPDGTYVVGTPVESDDVWVYQFVGNELQAAGKVLCDIKFTYSSGRISSGKFAFFVEKDTTIPGAAASQNYIIPMDQALAEMMNYKNLGKSVAEAAEESASAAADSAAAAKESEESAAAIVGIGIATTTTPGIVKPDGTSITVGSDGTISSTGGSFTQQQSDWNQSDNTKVDYIKNKPTIPAAQIQSDWNQSDNSKKDFIKNKPDLSKKLDGKVFGTSTSSDGETVTFSGIDITKSYLPQAILPNNYDGPPVVLSNIEITNNSGSPLVYSVTYTLVNASVNQQFELLEIG